MLKNIKARLKEPSTWLALGVPLIALGVITEGQLQDIVLGLGAALSAFGVIPEGAAKEPK